MPKRQDPATPTKNKVEGERADSLVSKQQAKRLFQGETAMDVDAATAKAMEREQKAKQQAKERDERRQRIDRQKKTGFKDRQKKGGKDEQDNERAEGDDDVGPDASRGRPKARKPAVPQRSTSKKRSDFDKAFPPPPKGSRGRRCSTSPPKRSSQSRGNSVESCTSNKSKKSNSDDSQAGDKCKCDSTECSSKSAKFQDGIPDNEGKTASTRKNGQLTEREEGLLMLTRPEPPRKQYGNTKSSASIPSRLASVLLLLAKTTVAWETLLAFSS
jgi:hypothetical protein